VLKWSRQNQTNQGEIFIGNIACWRIAIDNERLIYISDTDKHQVRKYKIGETNGTIVAGGHGKDSHLINLMNQLIYLLININQFIYQIQKIFVL